MNYQNLIIDGNNFIFRAYYTMRPPKYIDGLNTTPLHQFLYMLKNATARFSPLKVYLTWDKKINVGGYNFRKSLCAYKEQREETESILEIYNYTHILQDFLDAMGIVTIQPYNLEADDVVGYLARSQETKMIISSDRDLLQLVNENTHVNLPSKDIIVTPENFEAIATVKHDQFILYKSIMGDISDNIKGLEKFGPVRAKKLVLANLGKSIDEFNITEEQKTIIKNNIRVINIANGLIESPDEEQSYIEQLKNYAECKFDGDKLHRLFDKYQFMNYCRELGNWNRIFNPTETESQDDVLFNITM